MDLADYSKLQRFLSYIVYNMDIKIPIFGHTAFYINELIAIDPIDIRILKGINNKIKIDHLIL